MPSILILPALILLILLVLHDSPQACGELYWLASGQSHVISSAFIFCTDFYLISFLFPFSSLLRFS